MSKTIKYALKEIDYGYLRDKETREAEDSYTDDLGDAQLFETVELAEMEKLPGEFVVTIEIDEEGGMMEVSP